MPSEWVDDGIDASIYARSGAPPLIPRPSATYPREDVVRSDMMAAVMGMMRVSNLLVWGVDVGRRSHLYLYHFGRLPSLCDA
jgi:hypothetical protein